MSRMPFARFVAFNVAGGVTWGALCVCLGYIGGSSWRRMEHLASHVGLAVLALVVVLVAGVLVTRRVRAGWLEGAWARLSSSPPVVRVRDRFPTQTAWLRDRLDPTTSAGLGLTMWVLAALAATWAFLGITQDVYAHEELALLDPRLHDWVVTHRIGWLDPFMEAATWLGANAVVVPLLAIVVAVVARRRRSWAPVLVVAPLYVVTLLVHAVVQQAMHRPRPPVADWLSGASGWSYPSGHTLDATVAWGVLLLVLVRGRRPRTRALMTGGASAIVLLVATTRVYLGMHWLTDVLGSLALGIALLSIFSMCRLSIRNARTDPDLDRPHLLKERSSINSG